jgi:glycosyltransferase involved in cell wall biosynthesis
MRIAIVAPHFQEYSVNLANAVARRATVLLLLDRRRLASEFADRPMPLEEEVELGDAPLQSVFEIVAVLFRLARFRPDVIHLQEPAGFIRALICACVVACFRPFCRIVLTVHDPQPHSGRDLSIARRIAPLRNSIRRHAQVVLLHGESCRQEYLSMNHHPGQSVLLTTHGVILRDTAPDTPDHDGDCVVLCFGRMEHYKGLAVLGEAIARLRDLGASVRFRIVGKGPELDALSPRLASHANVFVENAFVSAARLIEEIRSATCVILPYLNASQSGVLAAALGNGRLAIASDVGGLRDVVAPDQNGLLVPPGDPEALANAIRRVADDRELRRKLSRGAMKTAERDLDWNCIVDGYWDEAYCS